MPDTSKSASSQDVPCLCASDLMHDILNNNQVAIGYLELAMERIKPENELLCMLNQVQEALRRSSDLAVVAYRAGRDSQSAGRSPR